MSLMLANPSSTELRSIGMSGTNNEKLGDVSLVVNAISIVEGTLLVEGKDTR